MGKAEGLISKEEQDEILRQEMTVDGSDERAKLDNRMRVERAERGK